MQPLFGDNPQVCLSVLLLLWCFSSAFPGDLAIKHFDVFFLDCGNDVCISVGGMLFFFSSTRYGYCFSHSTRITNKMIYPQSYPAQIGYLLPKVSSQAKVIRLSQTSPTNTYRNLVQLLPKPFFIFLEKDSFFSSVLVWASNHHMLFYFAIVL